MNLKGKLMTITLITSILGVVYYLNHSSKEAKLPSLASEMGNRIDAKHKIATSAESKNTIVEEVKASTNYLEMIDQAKEVAPSLDELSNKYFSQDNIEILENEMLQSKKIVSNLKLIEKANAASLSKEELVLFTTELRRQGILGVKLAELEVQKYEENHRE